jgi:hypothetical protein
MWTYDGEQWTDEGASERARNAEKTQQLRIEDMFLPELQVVVEIIRRPRKDQVPPFPMP